ncbi:uncharacterized protein [Aegilops tauschii subsp. strangulata]|nr:uncharacterized protein LOC120974442 [Aegilops tauschii subsp. strangulata]
MAVAAIALSLLLVAVAPAAVTCSEELAAVLRCHPAPALTDAFRATVLPLLAALPSAAAPTGFASLHSDGAFARGVCFGDSTTLPSGSECARCLSDAARNLTAGCGAASRRAGILSQRCSLWYADTNFSSPGEDAFLARFRLALPASSDSETSTGVYSAGLHEELRACRHGAALGRKALQAGDAVQHARGSQNHRGERLRLRLRRREKHGPRAGALRRRPHGGGLRPVRAALGGGHGLGPRRGLRRWWRGGRGGGLQLPRSVRGLHRTGAAQRPE